MFKVKSLCTLCAFLLICAHNFSQEINLSALSVPQELKEGANAVVRDYNINITIEDVDKMIVSKKKVVTVLNKLGNEDAAIVEGYDNHTKITDLTAEIYDALGNRIKRYKEKDFLDVSAVDGGTLYSDARVKYVDYTPISYPYTLVFESTYKTSTTGFIPWWSPINGYYVAVEKSTYTIHNPDKIPWRINEKNLGDFSIETSKSDDKISYILKKQNAFKYETNAPAARDFLPKTIISLNNFSLDGVTGSFTNWEEFGKWMHSSLIQGRDVIDEATKSKVRALVKDVTDPIERAKLVYKFMQDKTRYISVQVGIGGWQPIAANVVDEVGYGDCKGLTNYTKALLDVVGVESYFTLIYGGEKRNIDKDFSSFQGNHAILNIPNNGDDIWLECTSQTAPFGFLGTFTDDRDVLVITPEKGIIKHTTAYKGDTNKQTTKSNVTLLSNGDIKAEITRVSNGTQYDDKSYLDDFNEEELRKDYKSRTWGYLNNLDIKSLAISNNKEKVSLKENLDVTIGKYASVNENEYLFRLNIFNKNSYVPKRYRSRKLPLKINRGYIDEDIYTITIPENYQAQFLPEKKEIKTKFGTYSMELTKKDDSTLVYKRQLSIKDGLYTKEDYKSYRSFRKKIAKSDNSRIALTKK